MSKLHKIITKIRDRRLKIWVKEYIRFKIYLPVIKMWDITIDNYFGINTEIIIDLPSLGLDVNVGHRQESTPRRHIKRIIHSLEISPKDVFIDIGSGVGCVMLIAGKYPFKKIIGVDVSAELNKICEENIQKMKHRLKCKNFTNITSNAADYEIPDDVTFVYFFNPFGLEVMSNVIDFIFDSVSRRPRKVTIIWYNPKYEMELEKTYPIKKKNEMNWNNFRLFDSRCVIYEIGNS